MQIGVAGCRLVQISTVWFNFSRWQNVLRHFALNWAFLRFTDFQRGKYTLFFPAPCSNVVPLFELPIENNKHSTFEWRGQGRGVDSFVI